MNSEFLRNTGKRFIKLVDKKGNAQLAFDTWHQREELICLTDELVTAKIYIDLGWVKKRVLSKIILLSPEIQLVDLTNPLKLDCFQKEKNCFKKLLALFLTIRELKENGTLKKIIGQFYKDKFFILNGDALELEVRVALYKKDGSLRGKVLKKVKESHIYKMILREVESQFGKRERPLEIYKKPIKKISKFKEIVDLYKTTVNSDFSIPDNIYGFGKLLPVGDYYLLVPHSGFKFIDEISQRFGSEKILIYEKHFSKEGDFWISRKTLKNKKVFIFDVSYSGRTMSWVADIIKEEGGIPFKIAVWPKSWIAVNSADYVMFLDRIIERGKINLGDKDWAINLYKKLAFNK